MKFKTDGVQIRKKLVLINLCSCLGR